MSVEVTNVEEHEDGSATFTFDVSDAERNHIVNIGLKFLLYAGAYGKTTNEMFQILEREILKDENTVPEG